MGEQPHMRVPICNYLKFLLRAGQEKTYIWNEKVLNMIYGAQGGREGVSMGVEVIVDLIVQRNLPPETVPGSRSCCCFVIINTQHGP